MKNTLYALFLLALFSLPAFGQDCSKVSDEDIVNSIYERIEKKESLKEQISHINVTSTDNVVRIYGWVNSEDEFVKVRGYAIDTACVKLVNVNAFEPSPPSEEMLKSGCAGGTKPCGDICIPENEVCSIKGRMGFLLGDEEESVLARLGFRRYDLSFDLGL